jgi:cytochrome b561
MRESRNTAGMITVERYAASSRVLHWLTALLVVAVIIPLGLWIVYFEPKDEAFKLRLYNIHESCGVLVFALVLIRIWNRRRHPPPPLPLDTPPIVRFAAHVSHMSLSALLVIMPVLGFLATNAWGFPLKVFNALPMPVPFGKDESLAKVLSLLHWCGAIALISLIAAHLSGVVYHTFVRRDGLLRRIL